jgi:hypothetical protein
MRIPEQSIKSKYPFQVSRILSRISKIKPSPRRTSVVSTASLKSLREPLVTDFYNTIRLQSCEFKMCVSPYTKQLQLVSVPQTSNHADCLDYRHVADPHYSRQARFLKKDWVVRQRQLGL